MLLFFKEQGNPCYKKWVKSIQTAGYNGARTVCKYKMLIPVENAYISLHFIKI
jgi:hypothetical protein